MEKRYALALVVVEQVLLKDENGNGAWVEKGQTEWALVDDFATQKEAEDASCKLHMKYEE